MSSSERVNQQVKGAYVVASGISDPGRVRLENQDAIYLDKDGHFLLLADGMGGHERGAEASETAIEVVQEYLQPERVKSELQDITNVDGVPADVICLFALVDKGINKANKVLYERNQEQGLERYMGSTFVGLVPVSSENMMWFHVGDSRLYRWRDSTLKCLTVDHSAYAEWVRGGKSGAEPAKNIVTRAVGPREGVVPDIDWEKYEQGDLYIMCSDGLNDMLTDDEIVEILRDGEDEDVNSIANRLIDAALDAGGRDNTSVVVCKV
ncbi:MAG: serine/threonine-protein phosphatase [Deltaproteobacteria bacterium]|nr:serine/threonine-protein phosphatase [Deltaproteobacteria bacterium]MBW1912796.1 serine/threonine-protein phosphatase [Deltaproteobacteria bacterium]